MRPSSHRSYPHAFVFLGFLTSLAASLQSAPADPATQHSPDSEGVISTVIAPGVATNKRNTEGDVVVLKDGTLLAAWSDFYGGSSDFSSARISAAKSLDGGRTWTPRYTLQENVGKKNVMSVSLLRAQSGEILFFYLVKHSRTDLDCMVRRSADEAETWSDPVLITADPGYYVMNNDRVIQLKSGRILCPMSFTSEVWTKQENFANVIYFSDDSGQTWKRSRDIVRAPKRGAMEPGLIELDDGRVLQIIRTQLGMIWHAWSGDGGESWTEASPWTVAAPEAPSTLARIPDTGEFLLIYNPTVKLGTDHSGLRTPLVAAVSNDLGKTWSKPKRIESSTNATYAYTSITFEGKRALLTYYVFPNGGDKLSLKFKSIPLSWFRGIE